MKKPIRTLADLRKEQDKLKLEMAVAKHAFVKSLGQARNLTGRFVLTKLALPASLAGLAAFWLGGNREKGKKNSGSSLSWWQKAAPVAISILETIADTDQEEDVRQGNGAHRG